ncbi:MAG: hypothetical protein MK358_14295, partial [Vicinamibacterales bacterium]|nr:hypothetical protein [Vicinamibacterales bacterium]
MPLKAGTRLGHYDVTSLIGEGGMGQVWQARDTKLNRQVALKACRSGFGEVARDRSCDATVPCTTEGGLMRLMCVL